MKNGCDFAGMGVGGRSWHGTKGMTGKYSDCILKGGKYLSQVCSARQQNTHLFGYGSRNSIISRRSRSQLHANCEYTSQRISNPEQLGGCRPFSLVETTAALTSRYRQMLIVYIGLSKIRLIWHDENHWTSSATTTWWWHPQGTPLVMIVAGR